MKNITVSTDSIQERGTPWWMEYAKNQSFRFYKALKPNGECLEWTKGKDKDGYGKFQISLPRQGKKQKQIHVRSHRLAFLLAHGFIEDLVMHSCDNPSCCNPLHLTLGSQANNVKDCQNKNRRAIGENHGSAKILEADAKSIIDAKKQGVSTRLLMIQYKLGRSTIDQIGTYTWRHLA